MLENRRVAVVIPAYNEEKQILSVLEGIPDFVDRIIVVNDYSKDQTARVVMEHIKRGGASEVVIGQDSHIADRSSFGRADVVLRKMREEELKYFVPSSIANEHPDGDRVILISHLENGGVGAAIARGYKWCLDSGIDCAAVMAGDGQMDPAELRFICEPVIREGIDYVKGNRLIHRSAWLVVPRVRYIGNSILSILTKIASGYWHVSDTQCGYTAISRRALAAIRIHEIYRRYGMPNDLLVKLNIAFCTIKEIGIKPVYNVGEKSKMKIGKIVLPIVYLLLKSFVKRLWIKYLFRDFHPLFLLYHFSFALALIILPYAVKIARIMSAGGSVNPVTMLAFVFLFISSFQSFLFAMWMDIQDNERLYR
jgi:glycosyltransferase involved in cell wall biosynthesis